jgi:hypothetical protein
LTTSPPSSRCAVHARPHGMGVLHGLRARLSAHYAAEGERR